MAINPKSLLKISAAGTPGISTPFRIRNIVSSVTNDFKNLRNLPAQLGLTGYTYGQGPAGGMFVSNTGDASKWNRVPVEITIQDTKTGDYLQLPVVPETIDYSDGNPVFTTVKVINLGAVNFHNGVDLDGLSWDCFFPGRYDPAYCATPQLKSPVDYRNQFSTWKDEGTPLQLVIPAAGINKTMLLASFKWRLEGFEGDLAYSVEFAEHKTVTPKQVETGGELPPKGKKIPAERPAQPSSTGGAE